MDELIWANQLANAHVHVQVLSNNCSDHVIHKVLIDENLCMQMKTRLRRKNNTYSWATHGIDPAPFYFTLYAWLSLVVALKQLNEHLSIQSQDASYFRNIELVFHKNKEMLNTCNKDKKGS